MFSLARRQQVERSITRLAIRAIIRQGFDLDSVSNGEDHVNVDTVPQAMEHAFACDDAHIFFRPRGGPRGENLSWFWIVLGNEGWTVISDYTTDLDPAIDSLDPAIAKYEAEWENTNNNGH